MRGQGQQPQLEKGVISKGLDHSGVKVWVPPPGKPLGPAGESADSEVNLEWIMKEEEDEDEL